MTEFWLVALALLPVLTMAWAVASDWNNPEDWKAGVVWASLAACPFVWIYAAILFDILCR